MPIQKEKLDLTPLEEDILAISHDAATTKRRIGLVVISGLAAGAGLTTVSILYQSWKLVLGVSLVYIVLTVLEKVAYGRAVLGYKSVIRKLAARVEELERTVSDSR